MNPLEENVVDINCLRKNANEGSLSTSSASVDTDGLDTKEKQVTQMATAELIKIAPICHKALAEATVEVETNQLPACGNLELRPVKKGRIRECSDLRHWWDDEASAEEESSECA